MSRAPHPPLLEDRVAVALCASAVFLVAWGVVHTLFWAHGQLVDWPTYRDYGTAMVDGRVPYRDFAVEYPPGALPVFVIPSLAGGAYATSFAWLMSLCGVLLVGAVAWIRPAAAFYVALVPLLSGSLILSRFDLWPALLATLAVGALLADRRRIGWALLGAAVAAKLWPLVLVPLALVWTARRGRLREIVPGVVVLAVIVVPFAALAPHGLWSSLTGQGSRPLQVESLGASLLTTFTHPDVISSHGSQNIAGQTGLGSLFAALQVVALVSLWIAFARGPASAERLLRYAAGCVCAFVVFGKVLSPQYLLWLAPLVPLVRGRRGLYATALLTVAFVLTQVWFPQRYFAYALDFRLAGVVLLRNLVLFALLAVLVWPIRLARTA